MNFELLIDPVSASFVVLGTCAATLARSGWRDSCETFAQIAELTRKPFEMTQARAELSSQVTRMQRDGVIRTQPRAVSDRELTEATAALVYHRSIDALVDEHDRHSAQRRARREQAVATLNEAGELAPVLGLAGTLLALSQLPGTDLITEGAVMSSVSQAVVSTFYGLILGHLLFLPLASAIQRRGRLEDSQRSKLVAWLVEQLEPACPSSASRVSNAA
ncbi:MotA/TolQ/ExbB proton channel family protein [Erythrobacter sp. W53]|uniref:MotA/TolQ/ExbB proton channel family protein n=1 Tax=Erythrobacter sp. W53 TaxID=3425947 RepID=UPI003D767C75